MKTELRDTTGDGSRTGSVITSPVIAAIAAHAVMTVAGVVRLEPGLLGLAASLAHAARQRITGLDPTPTGGVRVVTGGTHTAPSVRLEIDLATSCHDQTAAIAQDVQRAVTRAVTVATGLTPTAVTVSVLDISLGGGVR